MMKNYLRMAHCYSMTISCLCTMVVFNTLLSAACGVKWEHLKSINSRPSVYLEHVLKTQQLKLFPNSINDDELLDPRKPAAVELEALVGHLLDLSGYFSGFGEFDDQGRMSKTSLSLLGVMKEVTEQAAGLKLSCMNDTGRLISALVSRQSWAIQFLDAVAKPGPSITEGWLNLVGNFQQCRSSASPPSAKINGSRVFSGNYCVLQAVLPVVPFPLAQLGTCFPSSCSSSQVNSFINQTMTKIGIKLQNELQIQAVCLKQETRVTTATVVTIFIVSTVVFLAVLGTFYDLCFVQNAIVESEGRSTWTVKVEEGQPLPNEDTPLLQKPATTKSTAQSVKYVIVEMILAFSIYRNGKKLLSTSQTSGTLSSIHGIRFLSMTWVMLGHVYMLSFPAAKNLATFIPAIFQRTTSDVITNAFVSVDTFFAISGLLTSYLTIQTLRRKGLRINWALFYFHRFWRLTPPYMSVLVIFLGLQQYLGQGPLWMNEQPSDRTECENYWWTNLLYVNNVIHSDKMCMPQSWYLSNDMQFFVLSPLMLIPFYFHWAYGVAICSGFLLVSWVTTGVLSAQNRWSTSISGIVSSSGWFDHYYLVPWCRIGPFVVGVLSGYFLSVTEGKPFKMRWWAVVLGWTVSIASALAVLYGIDGDISTNQESSVGATALYNAVSRSVWGACVCWVVVVCSAGYGGFVNSILSWSPFVVLGRLTFVVFLIHFNLVKIYFSNMGGTFYANSITLAVIFVGLLVITNLVAFVLSLLLESPMLCLEKVFFRKKER